MIYKVNIPNRERGSTQQGSVGVFHPPWFVASSYTEAPCTQTQIFQKPSVKEYNHPEVDIVWRMSEYIRIQLSYSIYSGMAMNLKNIP